MELPKPLPPENSAGAAEVAVNTADSTIVETTAGGKTATRAAKSKPAKTRAKTYATATLIKMMRQILARRIALMQEHPMEDGVKEVTLLAAAQRALGKLITMDSGRRATPRSKVAAAEMTELRIKIAARIEQLNQG